MAETEKLTLNVGAVDLGKIDLLVEQGHYSNRTDFIRTAIRQQLEKHTIEVQQSVTRNSYAMGAIVLDKGDFERHKAKGEKVLVRMIGYLHLTSDISPDLAVEVIDSIRVYGIFQASDDVKDALKKSGKWK
jgi:Arc/MetJ-type ribon-helix-helix transcriptional regulator